MQGALEPLHTALRQTSGEGELGGALKVSCREARGPGPCTSTVSRCRLLPSNCNLGQDGICNQGQQEGGPRLQAAGSRRKAPLIFKEDSGGASSSSSQSHLSLRSVCAVLKAKNQS